MLVKKGWSNWVGPVWAGPTLGKEMKLHCCKYMTIITLKRLMLGTSDNLPFIWLINNRGNTSAIKVAKYSQIQIQMACLSLVWHEAIS